MGWRPGSSWWRGAMVVVTLAAVIALPRSGGPALAQVKSITGSYDVEEIDSAEMITADLIQTGNTVDGVMRRNGITVTLFGSNSGPKFLGDWRGDDGSRGSFDFDLFPDIGRMEGLWRWEAPDPALKRQIWNQNLSRAPSLASATGAATGTGGAPPATAPPAQPPAPGAPAPADPVGSPPGPIFSLGANLGIAVARAQGDSDPADIRARLALVKQLAPQTGLPFDLTLIDVALQTLDSGAPATAVSPTLQTALAQFQQIADTASR